MPDESNESKQFSIVDPETLKNKNRREIDDAEIRQLEGWFSSSALASAQDRRRMERMDCFADGQVMTQADIAQAVADKRTTTNLNLARTTLELIAGHYAANPITGRVSAAGRGEGVEADAKIKDALMHYHQRDTKADQVYLEAFRQSLVSGVSWIYDWNEIKITSDGRKIRRIRKSVFPWQRVYWDPSFRESDYSDGRFVFLFFDLDFDLALRLFPNPDDEQKVRAAVCDYSASNFPFQSEFGLPGAMLGGFQNNGANDAFAYGAYGGGGEDGRRYHSLNNSAAAGVWGGGKSQERRRVWVCRAFWRAQHLDHEKGELEEKIFWRDLLPNKNGDGFMGLAGLKNRPARGEFFFIPVTPVVCRRNRRDGGPVGILEDEIEPSRLFNLAVSAVFNYANNSTLFMESDALDLPMDARGFGQEADTQRQKIARQLSMPNALITLASGGLGKIRLDRGTEKAQQFLGLADLLHKLMKMDIAAVGSASQGRDGRNRSGTAIDKLQQEAGLGLSSIMSNLTAAIENSAMNALTLIEFFGDAAARFPTEQFLTGARLASPEEILKAAGFSSDGEYDLSAQRAQYVITPSPASPALATIYMEHLDRAIGDNPQVRLAMLPMIFRLMPGPNARSISEAVAEILVQNGVNVAPDMLSDTAREAHSQQMASDAEGRQQQTAAEAENMQADTREKLASADSKLQTAQSNFLKAQAALTAAQAKLDTQAGDSDKIRKMEMTIETLQQKANELQKRLVVANTKSQ